MLQFESHKNTRTVSWGIFLAGLKIDAVDDKGAEVDFADVRNGSDKRKKMVKGGYWFLDQGGATPVMRA
jgi:hypothetical protein